MSITNKSIRIVLVDTSHPGNIGGAARAMKNMGLSRLVLVNPKVFPDHEATVRASGADEILCNTAVVTTLDEALTGCDVVFATSARSRHLSWPLITPARMAEQILTVPGEVAIVFGRESSGLTNSELSRAHFHVCIPTVTGFSSLNLAAAVQVMVYEIFKSGLKQNAKVEAHLDTTSDAVATADELQGLSEHFRASMEATGFLNANQPKRLMQRVKRILLRASLDKTEVNILRGFLTSIENKRNK